MPLLVFTDGIRKKVKDKAPEIYIIKDVIGIAFHQSITVVHHILCKDHGAIAITLEPAKRHSWQSIIDVGEATKEGTPKLGFMLHA